MPAKTEDLVNTAADRRDRIAEALARADGWEYASGHALRDMSLSTQEHYDKLADAVLAVLPVPADRAVILQEAADVAVRAARGCGDSETGQYAASVAADIGKKLRRMADKAPQPEGEAPCTCADAGDCFAPAGHYADCPQAIEAQQPEWCANCGLEVENRGVPSMDGNHRDRWVHIPGGYTICHPQQRDGLQATPAAKEAS